ncbi:hypothetical protein CCHR01_15841 [Colletotrichum chrysophilum]|uniref:Uncharacterized protein n=1 Tax=Colletotrichum chrysophilum TaxID=1836956 RepID=A0AAD9A5M4_9PEZI|nr:hypothetical protein CCHR01_15841 [Colletotrichum chrysophilum]
MSYEASAEAISARPVHVFWSSHAPDSETEDLHGRGVGARAGWALQTALCACNDSVPQLQSGPLGRGNLTTWTLCLPGLEPHVPTEAFRNFSRGN